MIIPPFWNDGELDNYVTEIVGDFFNRPISNADVLCKNMKIDFVERNKTVSRKTEKLRPSPITKQLPVVVNKIQTKRKINLTKIVPNLKFKSSSKTIFPCRVLTDDETIKIKGRNVKKESTWHEAFDNRHKVRTKDQALKNCEIKIINTELVSSEPCNTQKNVIFRGEEDIKAGEIETIRKCIDHKNLNIKKNCNIQMLPVMSIRGEKLNSVQKLHRISITPAVQKPNTISCDEPKNIKFCQFIYNGDKMRTNDGIDNRIQLDETEIEEQKGKSNKNSNCQTETNPEDFLLENENKNTVTVTDETIENSKSYFSDLKDSNSDKIAPFSNTVKEKSVSYNSSFEKTISSSSDISLMVDDEKIGKRKRKCDEERDLRQRNQVNVLSDGSCQQRDTNKLEKRDFTKQQVSC